VIHPIEAESYRRLEAHVDLSHLPRLTRAVVARIIHASADVDYARTVIVDEGDLEHAVSELHAGAAVVTDVEMVRHGITGWDATCCIASAGSASIERTRSAAAMRLAVEMHPEGVFVVGCAPTALFELIELAAQGHARPAFVIGLPVGFVGAAEAKEALRASGVRALTNIGPKGGSPVAAAAFNALGRIVRDHST
jgi:precorrin-8X/cobalt-precorrin-8 methylmutase